MSGPDLNEPQQEAVEHESGPLLVFAGAGSGKTRVITQRAARLVSHAGVAPWRILAVTFTNKAAGEMRQRLTALLGDTARDLWVGTFHATCARLLRRHAADVGLERAFVIYDDADQRAVIARVMQDLDLDDRQLPVKRFAWFIDHAKQEAQGPDDVPESGDPFNKIAKRVYAEYQKRLRASGAADFGDLLLLVLRIAESQGEAGASLRSRYDHVLVDEFQDTNHVQYRLVRALGGATRNVCVVGDDDQAIYRWRGADVRNILGFRSDFPDARVVKLEQNYRSTKRILRAAHAIISRSAAREPKQLWTDNADGPPVVVLSTEDERDEARVVVATIRQLRAEGLALGDVAIFYRIHAQSRVLEEALRAANLPYVVVGGTRFYDRAEVKDLLAYLKVIQNPLDDVNLLRIVNVPARGLGKSTLDRVLVMASLNGISAWDALPLVEQEAGKAASSRLSAFRALVDALREAAPALRPSELAREVLERTGYLQSLREDDSAESDARIGNLEELVGSMVEYEQEAADPSLAAWLETVSLHTSLDEAAPADRVTMMTVHAAKGLEYAVVIVTGMEEGMFPYKGIDEVGPSEELEEERRLAYVAFTRARKRLLLTHASMRRLFGSPRAGIPSRFVDELPEADIQRLGAARPTLVSRTPLGQGAPFGQKRPQPSSDRGRGAARSGRPGPASPVPRREGSSYVDRSFAQEAAPDVDGAALARGTRVRHAKFGVGQVRDVLPGVPARVAVDFPGWGLKQIVASFLEPA